MRIPLILSIALLSSACGSLEYRDSNAAVDANPLCVGSDSDRPGEPATSAACDRKSETSWNAGKDGDDKPIDFDGKDDD